MQRMFNLDKWDRLAEGQSLKFINDRPRTVRLEVNAPVKSALYVVDHTGEVHFLALVEGRDTIEFSSGGAFELTVEGADVLVYTADGADISNKIVAPKIFTKIVERRRRNPELEYMAAVMQRNMERNLEKQWAEREQTLLRSIEARAPVAAPAGVPDGAPAAPAQADGAAPSDPQAADPAGGVEDGLYPPS